MVVVNVQEHLLHPVDGFVRVYCIWSAFSLGLVHTLFNKVVFEFLCASVSRIDISSVYQVWGKRLGTWYVLDFLVEVLLAVLAAHVCLLVSSDRSV